MAKITVAEYAASRKKRGLSGGTVQAVWKAGESGRITITDGHVDPETADFEWQKNTRKRADLHGDDQTPAASVPPAAAGQNSAPSWADAKARTEAAVAELKELELAQKKGELIDRAGYERAAQKTLRTLRDALVDVLPAKLAVELAALADPWAVECRLREAVRGELTAVAGQLREEAAA